MITEYEMITIPHDIVKKMDEHKIQIIGYITLLVKYLQVEDFEKCAEVKKQLDNWKVNAATKMNELCDLSTEYFIDEYTKIEKTLLHKMMIEHCSFLVD